MILAPIPMAYNFSFDGTLQLLIVVSPSSFRATSMMLHLIFLENDLFVVSMSRNGLAN